MCWSEVLERHGGLRQVCLPMEKVGGLEAFMHVRLWRSFRTAIGRVHAAVFIEVTARVPMHRHSRKLT